MVSGGAWKEWGLLLLVGVCLLALSLTGCAKVSQRTEMELARPYPPEARPTPDPYAYTVVRGGDCLWSLSGAGYGDGMMWPLLWKANRDQVGDPDLIDVGMELRVLREPDGEARTRAWDEAAIEPEYRPGRR